ncbi:hypothetical protein LOY43_20310 [Pseudomonas sp. B21-041]|uniref:hypothetical protein n=1 Tax=Pseudomonas sp. B21-041 TaxID=2895487 RepID=UPI002160AB92|nr:hypothetical protein [Pseudomonas sp. B21-041]UVL33297.1 hypothetical protein LOY43_20310 [Pseudomonas sp. B21-041]
MQRGLGSVCQSVEQQLLALLTICVLSNSLDKYGVHAAVAAVGNCLDFCAKPVRYRGEACAYMGGAMFTKKNEPTDNPALDRCGGWWSSCKLRGNTRRFGGSMGASLITSSR